MKTQQSYEYLSILDMCAKDAFAHLLKFGIITKRENPLLGWVEQYTHNTSNKKIVTKVWIDYLHSDWVCLIENGICVDVWPTNYEGEL